MSEQQAQERTEQPTPKRLQKAREKGQVPRSRELNTMAVALAGAAALVMFGGWMVEGMRQVMVTALSAPATAGQEHSIVVEALAGAMIDALFVITPILVVAFVAALAGPVMIGGMNFSFAAARPKFDRLNPVSGLKRIFSAQGAMELVKTVLKFTVLTSVAIVLLWMVSDELLALGRGSVEAGMVNGARIVQRAALLLAGGLVLIAAIDAPFQLWNHLRQLRMTRQEIKDELKESDGNPEMRGRLRRAQRAAANARMMHEVPDADIVITNPVHFAVALRYTDRPDRAPRVVAKGRDLVAARIRDLAAEHSVVTCQSPALARAIYFHTELGHEIPAGLYLAVARVLAWVMQVNAAMKGGTPTPAFPQGLVVPDEFFVGEVAR